MIKFRSLALLAGVSLLGTACGPESAPADTKQMSWEEFKANVYQEPGEDGVFIVDRDIPLATEAELREFYENYVLGNGPDTHAGELAVYYSGGKDVKWSASQAQNLTYCVSTKFGSNYSKVVSAMASATSAWEASANVNFVHVSAQDSNCTNRNSAVVFDVNPVNTTQYLARAFFPGSSRRSAQHPGGQQLVRQHLAVDAHRRAAPRAGPHPGLPPRAHPREQHRLLRGQRLARADAVRRGLGDALPAVQWQQQWRPVADHLRQAGRGHPLPVAPPRGA